MADYQHYRPMHMALHERCFPHHVMEGIWIWSTYSEPLNIHFNSYLVQTGDRQSFIVDPVAQGPEVLDGIVPLPTPRQIILTTADHERDTQQFKDRFQIPVSISEQDARLLSFRPDHTFQDNTELPGGWRTIHLADQKTPGEYALYQAERKILIVGDAIIGKPIQFLSLPSADAFPNASKAREGLRPLLKLDVQTILPGAGDPVMLNVNSLIADIIEPHH